MTDYPPWFPSISFLCHFSGSSNRTSAEEMLTLLTREPPDGKEKPEPSKSSLLKMETLSRKSSKCDLLSSNSSSNSPQVIQQQQQTSQSTIGNFPNSYLCSPRGNTSLIFRRFEPLLSLDPTRAKRYLEQKSSNLQAQINSVRSSFDL